MKLFFYCILFQLVTALSHAAPPVVIDPENSRYPLGGHIEILEDKQDKLTIDDVTAQYAKGGFKDSRRNVPNFGYTRSTFWLTFTVRSGLPETCDMLLEFDWPHTDFIEFFVFIKDGDNNYVLTENKRAGRKMLMADRQIKYRNFLFNLPLESQTVHYVFLRLKTDDSLRAPMILWEPQAFRQHAKNEYFLLGAFYGLMFVIIFYNLLVYLTTKDLSFLLFILHIAPTALFELAFNGLGYEYLWPFSPQFAAKAMPVFVFLLTSFAAVFSKQFLHLKTHIPLSDKLLNIIIAMSAAGMFILLTTPAPVANAYTAGLASIYPVVLFFISIQSLKHGIPYSKHFIFIWAIVLVSTTIAGLTFIGILPHVPFTNYFHQCGSALEASLFSIVLAGRINVLREKNKEAELFGRQAEQKREAAVASSKAKSAFLANMSHEIRTPINAITGMLYLLKETQMTQVQQDFTEKMRISAGALLGIINDILDISKIEAGKLKLEHVDFQLNTVIENVTTLVEMTTAQKNLDLIVSYNNISCMDLYGDPLRLGQVLTNLVNNAVKFTDKGEVGIYCRKIGTNRFRFDVKDTGIGLTQAEMDRLFHSFSQADVSTTRKYGGTGLGLAISKRLVEMMEGHIWVESVPGKGSIFAFEVTLAEREQASGKRETFDNKTALIIDQSAAWRKVASQMLARHNIKSQATADAKKALAMLGQETFGLVFVDRQIQAMGWQETIDAINRQVPDPPHIIVMTQAYHQKEMMQAAWGQKIAAFLCKPVNPGLLYDIIYKIFTGETIEHALPRGNFDIASLRQEIKTLKGSHILLVDDIKLNREIICGILRGSGIIIHEAENGQDALDMVRKASEPYELVFMDIQMPVMDGYEATERIRQINPQIPIIALTASAMENDVKQAMATGATRHLCKPVEVDQLFMTLLKYVSKKCAPVDAADDIPPVTSGPPAEAPQEAAMAEKLPSFCHLDVSQGLRHMNGDKALYIKMLCNFADDYQGITAKLRKNLGRDKDQAVRIAHTVKGLAANIGAAGVHRLAEQFEKTLDLTILPDLENALNEVIDEIRASSIIDDQPETIIKTPISPRQCDALWRQLSEVIATHRPHQIQPVLAQLEAAALEPDDARQLKNVTTALKKYRFRKALDEIKQKR